MEREGTKRRGRLFKLSGAIAAVSFALLLPATASATAPTVTTDPATNIDSSSAVLNGTVNANDKAATVRFDYATDRQFRRSGGAYANSTPDSPLVINVLGVQVPLLFVDAGVSARVTGLSSKTTYHFRIVATNADGTSTGADLSFKTS